MKVGVVGEGMIDFKLFWGDILTQIDRLTDERTVVVVESLRLRD